MADNDTLTSDGKSNVLLVGGSGNDSLIISSGNGTLSGSDVVLSDSAGRLAVTLKGVRENDYFDGTASDEAWEVLKLTNDERETQGLSQLTASEGLTAGASVRAQEITTLFDHTRPDGTNWSTVLEKSYSANAENVAEGQNSAASVVTGWMNSSGHRANILNSDYQKLGVGYYYEDTLDYEHYWVQLFGSNLISPETVSTSNLLETPIEVNTVGTDSPLNIHNYFNNTLITGTELTDTISNSGDNVTIQALGGNDTITNSGADDDTLNNGDDYLDGGNNVTIGGGAGNDIIRNRSRHIDYVNSANLLFRAARATTP